MKKLILPLLATLFFACDDELIIEPPQAQLCLQSIQESDPPSYVILRGDGTTFTVAQADILPGYQGITWCHTGETADLTYDPVVVETNPTIDFYNSAMRGTYSSDLMRVDFGEGDGWSEFVEPSLFFHEFFEALIPAETAYFIFDADYVYLGRGYDVSGASIPIFREWNDDFVTAEALRLEDDQVIYAFEETFDGGSEVIKYEFVLDYHGETPANEYEDDDLVAILQSRAEGFYGNPIYQDIDQSSDSYFSAFLADAAAEGVDISHVLDGQAAWDFDDTTDITSTARANASCDDALVHLTVNQEFWDTSSWWDYHNLRIRLIWHELGHDILNLAHVGNPNDIMYAGSEDDGTPLTNDPNSYEGFIEAKKRMFSGEGQIERDCENYNNGETGVGDGDGPETGPFGTYCYSEDTEILSDWSFAVTDDGFMVAHTTGLQTMALTGSVGDLNAEHCGIGSIVDDFIPGNLGDDQEGDGYATQLVLYNVVFAMYHPSTYPDHFITYNLTDNSWIRWDLGYNEETAPFIVRQSE